MHTWMIARILLRAGMYYSHFIEMMLIMPSIQLIGVKMHFQPYKPLPCDVPIMQHPKRQMPIGRVFIDIVVGILCLGILFLVDRPTYGGNLDLESGIASNPGGSMFLVGACMCLVVSFTI